MDKSPFLPYPVTPVQNHSDVLQNETYQKPPSKPSHALDGIPFILSPKITAYEQLVESPEAKELWERTQNTLKRVKTALETNQYYFDPEFANKVFAKEKERLEQVRKRHSCA